MTAHLDSTALKLAGELRLIVAFADMSGVAARGGALAFSSPAGEVELQLGEPAAGRWAEAIRNPKSRVQKFGVAAGRRVCAIACDPDFLAELETALGAPPTSRLRGSYDVIVRGLASSADLAQIAVLAGHLEPAGALWLVHPKGRSAAIPEGAVREAIRAAGLVDTKIAAFSDTHTATKAMIPRAARAR